MMSVNPDSPTLKQLLEYTPSELSSGVAIRDWVVSQTANSFEFDLSQIDREPKDSVTKYLNWVCLNAKIFNSFGILLNSAQINNFIAGTSTEIYIILKQLDDKIKESLGKKQETAINSTKSAPSPSMAMNLNGTIDLNGTCKIPSITRVKSATAASSRRVSFQDQSKSVPVAPNKPVTSTSLISPALDANKNDKMLQNKQNEHEEMVHNILKTKSMPIKFPSLSLAISPTISDERNVERVKTTTSADIVTSSKSIRTIQENEPLSMSEDLRELDVPQTPIAIKDIPDIPDIPDVPDVPQVADLRTALNDDIPQKPDANPQMPFISKYNNRENVEKEHTDINIDKITNPINAFQQFHDHVIYDGIKLYGDNVDLFLNEKEKLEDKLNDAMGSYQNNNAQYLHNIVEQYRTQKLKQAQGLSTKPEQKQFLLKLKHDLEILDESLNSQFEESQKTLYVQLTSIHHKRLKEFATKLNGKTIQNNNNQISENVKIRKLPPKTSQTETTVNKQNNNSDNIVVAPKKEKTTKEMLEELLAKKEAEEKENPVPTGWERNDIYKRDLHAKLQEVSVLLEKCWKNEMIQQQKEKPGHVDQGKELETMKEIMCVYQNLAKLIQVQANILKETIYYHNPLLLKGQKVETAQQTEINEVGSSTESTSPDKTKVYLIDNYGHGHGQVQLLSDADGHLPENAGYYIHPQDMNQEVLSNTAPYAHNRNEPQNMNMNMGMKGLRRKRKKSSNKKSNRNNPHSTKTSAFSFDCARGTVSSQNKANSKSRKKALGSKRKMNKYRKNS